MTDNILSIKNLSVFFHTEDGCNEVVKNISFKPYLILNTEVFCVFAKNNAGITAPVIAPAAILALAYLSVVSFL